MLNNSRQKHNVYIPRKVYFVNFVVLKLLFDICFSKCSATSMLHRFYMVEAKRNVYRVLRCLNEVVICFGKENDLENYYVRARLQKYFAHFRDCMFFIFFYKLQYLFH